MPLNYSNISSIDDELEKFFNQAKCGFHSLDADGYFVKINDIELSWLGYQRDEVVGKLKFKDCLTPVSREIFEENYPRFKQEGRIKDLEFEIIRRDGVITPVLLNATAISDEQGNFVRTRSYLVDLTRHSQRTQKYLEKSQAQMAGIVASAMDAIITIDSDQRIILFNLAAEKMFGTPVNEALGQEISKFIPDRFHGAHRQHIKNFSQTHTSKRTMNALGAVYGIRSNGEEFPVEASISQMETDGNKFFTVILRDITERKRAEARLTEQAALLNQAQDAIIVRDLNDRILFWNQSAERIYGWSIEEAMGRDAKELAFRSTSTEFMKAREAVISNGEWYGEISQLNKAGKEIITECRWTLVRDDEGQPKSILAINTDITAHKKLEMQFLRAQRLESIGTLAGGIAHDLNNVLSPLLIATQMLQLKFTDPESQRWLQVMLTNIERGTEMVKQILVFARGSQGDRITLQPKHLIKEIVKILKETFPKNIDINFLISEEPWQIMGDATQLHQVLINLCVNARDAMPTGGKLYIETQNQIFDEAYARMNPQARAGRYVVITVSDTGFGIPAETLNRIFDPFFTTKEHGKGTGLGLATVQGIIKGHNGFINVYSEIGKGTKFTIYIPAAAITESVPLEARLPKLPLGKGEVILIVDDEEAIREITQNTLEACGYNALTAADGAEAIAIYATNQNKIKVVLTDMMMPVMDGPATIRALKKLTPNIKIIACSGLSEEAKILDAQNAGVEMFLPKPFSREKLLEALASVLNGE